MKLWSGRIRDPMNEDAARLNASLPFDRRLAGEDVRGSLAWSRALHRAGVLNDEETERILAGLEQVQSELDSKSFAFGVDDEDIHTAVERRLTELLGPVAGKLHTGRSRNDQVSTDFRLWMMEALGRADQRLRALQSVLITRAEADFGIVLPGYTHLQQAQPILLSHWWLAHFWALHRDRQRLRELGPRVRLLPLGSGALAGTAYPIDRTALARDLDFDSPFLNSVDAVSDRDFVGEFLFLATLIGAHLSRLAEALILFSTSEFGFIDLAEAFSTGSSLMPQKKNPDPLELVRARCGMLIGRLTGWLATWKALPSAYDKDLQEDKPPVFDAADTLDLVLAVMAGAIATISVHGERMRAAIDPQVLASDVADYLVEKGLPFREAHGIVGQAVRRAQELRSNLSDLPLETWRSLHPAFDVDVRAVFDIERSISRRAACGGTAPEAVREQLRAARQAMDTP